MVQSWGLLLVSSVYSLDSTLMQELRGAGGGVLVEGGRQQVAAGVNVANVSSGVVGKRTDRVQNVDLGTARAGWEILPPRDRLEKRSAADRVAGLSDI